MSIYYQKSVNMEISYGSLFAIFSILLGAYIFVKNRHFDEVNRLKDTVSEVKVDLAKLQIAESLNKELKNMSNRITNIENAL